MKAVKLYEPGNLKVEEVDVPQIDQDEVLLKVKAVGICGSDIPRALVKGAYYEGITLGHEFSGEIVSCGEAVDCWEIGDRVTVAPLVPCRKCDYCNNGKYSLCESYNYYGSRTDGAMAHFIKVNYRNLLKLPDNISYEDGAMVDPAANAVHGLWRGNITSGDTTVIIGLGAIGLFAVQFARVMGAKKVIAIDIFDEKLEIAKELGADVTINSMKQNPEDFLEGEQIDCILETSGSPIAQNQAILIAGKLARVVFLGISNRDLQLSSKAVNQLLRNEIHVNGSWNSFSNPFPGREWTYSIQLMSEGKIKTAPIVSHRLKLSETPNVFMQIKNKEIVFNKILILPEA
jgi:L-iditol 2-dehydrogenase